MNVFDIIGPVMIGPSSSHTAGAVRLGRVVNKLIDRRTLKRVEITLSGSFAQTYKGHGIDIHGSDARNGVLDANLDNLVDNISHCLFSC